MLSQASGILEEEQHLSTLPVTFNLRVAVKMLEEEMLSEAPETAYQMMDNLQTIFVADPDPEPGDSCDISESCASSPAQSHPHMLTMDELLAKEKPRGSARKASSLLLPCTPEAAVSPLRDEEHEEHEAAVSPLRDEEHEAHEEHGEHEENEAITTAAPAVVCDEDGGLQQSRCDGGQVQPRAGEDKEVEHEERPEEAGTEQMEIAVGDKQSVSGGNEGERKVAEPPSAGDEAASSRAAQVRATCHTMESSGASPPSSQSLPSQEQNLKGAESCSLRRARGSVGLLAALALVMVSLIVRYIFCTNAPNRVFYRAQELPRPLQHSRQMVARAHFSTSRKEDVSHAAAQARAPIHAQDRAGKGDEQQRKRGAFAKAAAGGDEQRGDQNVSSKAYHQCWRASQGVLREHKLVSLWNSAEAAPFDARRRASHTLNGMQMQINLHQIHLPGQRQSRGSLPQAERASTLRTDTAVAVKGSQRWQAADRLAKLATDAAAVANGTSRSSTFPRCEVWKYADAEMLAKIREVSASMAALSGGGDAAARRVDSESETPHESHIGLASATPPPASLAKMDVAHSTDFLPVAVAWGNSSGRGVSSLEQCCGQVLSPELQFSPAIGGVATGEAVGGCTYERRDQQCTIARSDHEGGREREEGQGRREEEDWEGGCAQSRLLERMASRKEDGGGGMNRAVDAVGDPKETRTAPAEECRKAPAQSTSDGASKSPPAPSARGRFSYRSTVTRLVTNPSTLFPRILATLWQSLSYIWPQVIADIFSNQARRLRPVDSSKKWTRSLEWAFLL